MEMSIRFPGIDLILSYVPRSFQIFGMEFTIYGVLIAAGALFGIGLVALDAKRNGQDQNKYLDMMLISLLSAVIGSRLFYVAFSWDLYNGDIRAILDFRNGGYAFYGGLAGGILAAGIFCRIADMPFWKMADTVIPGILLGQTIGRWGNFFNRESFGEYADLPWAMQLPLSAVRSGEVSGTMRDNLLTIDGMSYIQVQPVFLYESLWCLVLLCVLLALRRKKKYEGELFMIYLAGYGLGRFFFEWLRTDKLCIPGTRIGISLLISAVLFIIFGPMVIVRGVMAQKRAAIWKRRRRMPAETYEEKADGPEEAEISEKEMQTDGEQAAGNEITDLDTQADTQPDRIPENGSEEISAAGSETKSGEEKEKSEENAQKSPEISESSEEMLNWENSEYAHIPEQWRQYVGNVPKNSEEDK